MGKAAKDHRKKVAKRNEAIKEMKKKNQKIQIDFLKQLIEKEKAAGKFNSIPVTNEDGIVLNISEPILSEQNGPIL